MRRTLLLALLGVALSGCATVRFLLWRPLSIARCPGTLVPTSEIPGEFTGQERLRVRSDDGSVDAGFTVAVEKKGDRIAVVGWNAFGAKAFSIVQQGTRTTSDRLLGPALPVPPENVLRDLHRARFQPRESASPGVTVIEQREPPGTVVVHNERCGYTATFVPVGRPLLRSGDSSSP
jgi:hypothetical protein